SYRLRFVFGRLAVYDIALTDQPQPGGNHVQACHRRDPCRSPRADPGFGAEAYRRARSCLEKIPVSELRDLIERYSDDRASLRRTYTLAFSEMGRTRMRQFYTSWLERIGKLNFDAMSQDGRIDYILLKNQFDYELRQLDNQAK